MKTKLVTAIAVMMGLTLGAMAQHDTFNASIKANAAVATGVSISPGTNLDFKNVTPGVAKTIGFTDDVTAGTATGTETTGHFTVSKTADTQVTLLLSPLPSTLAGPNSSTLAIAYAARLYDGAASYAITTPGSDVVVANSGGTAAFFGEAEFDLDLGGTVTPTANQPSGSYTADVTLTVTYN